MGASAIFIDQEPAGRRITVVVDEASCLELVTDTLLAAGFHLESVDHGVDTAWDVAASGPDVVILAVAKRVSATTLQERLEELREHPRLHGVPVLICSTTGLRPVQMAAARRAKIEILEPAGTPERLGAVLRGLPSS